MQAEPEPSSYRSLTCRADDDQWPSAQFVQAGEGQKAAEHGCSGGSHGCDEGPLEGGEAQQGEEVREEVEEGLNATGLRGGEEAWKRGRVGGIGRWATSVVSLRNACVVVA